MQNRLREHVLLCQKVIFSRRTHLDIKEVKILTKSDVPEEFKDGDWKRVSSKSCRT